jgi:hypothetical protein
MKSRISRKGYLILQKAVRESRQLLDKEVKQLQQAYGTEREYIPLVKLWLAFEAVKYLDGVLRSDAYRSQCVRKESVRAKSLRKPSTKV